jgi:hypothetical protein
VLSCLVSGGAGHDGVAAGQVVWLAVDGHWIGVRADPGGDGRRMVALAPVERVDIGVWVAEYLAEILDAAAVGEGSEVA